MFAGVVGFVTMANSRQQGTHQLDSGAFVGETASSPYGKGLFAPLTHVHHFVKQRTLHFTESVFAQSFRSNQTQCLSARSTQALHGVFFVVFGALPLPYYASRDGMASRTLVRARNVCQSTHHLLLWLLQACCGYSLTRWMSCRCCARAQDGARCARFTVVESTRQRQRD